MIAADFIAEELARRGVRHVFGVGGANIEDMFAAVQRRRPGLQAVLAKHEHGAGTAADAYARTGGGLGVVMVTSGGGAMNLVHALAEARASRVPVLAIVGEPPTDVQGRGAFQDTSGRNGAVDALDVFLAVSVFCARVADVGELPGLLDAAIAAARGDRPGPAVLLLAKDRQQAAMPASAAIAHPRQAPPPAPRPDPAAIRRAADVLSRGPVAIIAGDEITRSGAAGPLAALARALGAMVAVTPDARDAFDNDDPRFVGVAGAMGHAAVARAVARSRVCLLAGTRLPLLARSGIEAALLERPLVSLGREPPFIAPADGVHLDGDPRETLVALFAELGSRRAPASAPSPSLPLAEPAAPAPALPLGSPGILALVERALPDGGVVVIDAGNTGAHAVHHLRLPRGGRSLIAMGMAGMGWSFGAAVGAALASGRRTFVLAGDGAFFMHGLEVHTALEHRLPITYLVFNNRAHGMCVVRERLLLREETGYNRFGVSHVGAGLAAMFPGLRARDCGTLDEVARALAEAASADGPSVVCAELPEVEVPPFAAFRQALAEQAAAAAPTPALATAASAPAPAPEAWP
jgi:acetolactate synthase-1/2/3 large subunit